MDPYAVLGLRPGASAEEAVRAYRRLAKRWHPDRAGAREAARAERRMAEINAAFAALQEGAPADPPASPPGTGRTVTARGRRRGAWLPEATRRALGPELLGALQPGERVDLVTPAATWASPESVLAVTDRRLLWLLDDAVTSRVRFLAFGAVAGTERRVRWPRRGERSTTLRVRTRGGRRLSFGELSGETAERIALLVDRARPAERRSAS